MPRKVLLVLFLILTAAPFLAGFHYELGKPAFDSGWKSFNSGFEPILYHNLGGSVDDYVVDLQFRSESKTVNQFAFGGMEEFSEGAFWHSLTDSSITIERVSSDILLSEFRVRIWKLDVANYDSGWVVVNQGESRVLNHGIGGNTDNYVVYMEFKDTETYGIHQYHYGETHGYDFTLYGASWSNLTGSTIFVNRGDGDVTADHLRVRIWRMRNPDFDSGWQTRDSLEMVFDHNLGGPWNDYVVDMQFWDEQTYGVHQLFYGYEVFGFYNEQGAYWNNLDSSQISVSSGWGDSDLDKVRIRIWKCSAPKYDSGWTTVSGGSYKFLTHDLGGNVDDYMVDMEFKDSGWGGINNRFYGTCLYTDPLSGYMVFEGAYWSHLDTSQIRLWRYQDDSLADQIRIRIWIPPTPDFDSGWTTITPGYVATVPHNLGGNPDDYVVYLEFKRSDAFAVHHMIYGGDWRWNALDSTINYFGVFWEQLDDSIIKIHRYVHDTNVNEFRVRIWKNADPHHDWKSDWAPYAAGSYTLNHYLGENAEDYVLDMRFKSYDIFGDHIWFYGSMQTKVGEGSYLDQGVYFFDLNNSSMSFSKRPDGFHFDDLMFRIWDTAYKPKTVFVSGTITSGGFPLPGVIVSFSGEGTCMTDANGRYAMSLPYGYTGSATPSLSGYIFTPSYADYSSIIGNWVTDYWATSFGYTLSISAGSGGTTNPAPGNHYYMSGTEVEIEALPKSGYQFSHWTGDVPSGHETDNPLTTAMDGDRSVTAHFTYSTHPLGYFIFDSHDFNGDGSSDVSVWRPSNGRWYLNGVGSQPWGQSGDIPVNGDYSGDGTTDMAVWRSSNGRWYINGVAGAVWGTSGDIPVPGDYDGDGSTDIAVWRPSNGRWYIKGIGGFAWGLSGDIPVPDDYDGDGSTDIAVWRPSNGHWYILGVGGAVWGTSGDIPVPGDYDGNGTADIAVWRQSDGRWYIKGGSGSVWGQLNDIPVPGDYNGDTITDFAVWRPSNGKWYIKDQGSYFWGLTGDIPLVR
jgi:hypothetical protein